MRKPVMRVVWRSNDHEPNFFDGEQFVERANSAHIGILCSGFVAVALQNRRESQSWHGANHRRVKGAPGKSKADETHIDHRSIQEWIIKASEQRSQTYRERPSILSHR